MECRRGRERERIYTETRIANDIYEINVKYIHLRTMSLYLFFIWIDDDLKFMQNYIMSKMHDSISTISSCTEPFLRMDFQLNPFNAI